MAFVPLSVPRGSYYVAIAKLLISEFGVTTDQQMLAPNIPSYERPHHATDFTFYIYSRRFISVTTLPYLN